MSSENLHEPRERLSAHTIAMHQAIVSLMEELDAIDWYQQRADGCEEIQLREVLLHNMREEVEHACMVLEWLRRNSDEFGRQLRTYLFREGDITEIEEIAEAGDTGEPGKLEGGGPGGSSSPFTVGPLK